MPAAAVSGAITDTLADGREVMEYRLSNAAGTEASVLTLGATLRSLRTADAAGHVDDIVLGFDTADEYLRGSDYFGATIGRYANRIAGGRFEAGGKRHRLEINS